MIVSTLTIVHAGGDKETLKEVKSTTVLSNGSVYVTHGDYMIRTLRDFQEVVHTITKVKDQVA